MFSKTNLVSTLVLTIWGFFGGYLLWGLLADNYFQDHVLVGGVMKETPDFTWLIIGTLVSAWAFSSIYRAFGKGRYGVASGLGLGVLAAVMNGLGEGLIDHSTANLMDLEGTFVNFLIYLVFLGVMGLLAGAIYGKMEKTA